MNKKALLIIILIMGLLIFCLNSNKRKDKEESTSNDNFNRAPENVTIEIDENTITTTSVSIIITDNNEAPYVWGVEFRIQKKVNEEWHDLKYITDTVAFRTIGYKINTKNQLTQNIAYKNIALIN